MEKSPRWSTEGLKDKLKYSWGGSLRCERKWVLGESEKGPVTLTNGW